jgi:hypothetical protein
LAHIAIAGNHNARLVEKAASSSSGGKQRNGTRISGKSSGEHRLIPQQHERTMQTSFRFLLCSLTAACVFRIAVANDDDDRAVADEAYAADDNTGDGNYKFYYDEGVDYIEYWTDYAIQPKRCVV